MGTTSPWARHSSRPMTITRSIDHPIATHGPTSTPARSTSTASTAWPTAAPGTYFMGIVHNGSRFVAVGRKCYAYSTDGVTWTFVQDSVAHMCIARNGSLMVSSVVETGSDPADWLQSTTDGVTWTVIQ